MSMNETIAVLRENHIPATPQRIAVAEFVLQTKLHPTADQVLEEVRKSCPTISRGTVYNTLNLLVDKGLLRTKILKPGTTTFDPNVAEHHHFIDEETGEILDIPWDAISVSGHAALDGLTVSKYQVILEGKRKGA